MSEYDSGHANGYNDARTVLRPHLIRVRAKYTSEYVRGYHVGWNQAVREGRKVSR